MCTQTLAIWLRAMAFDDMLFLISWVTLLVVVAMDTGTCRYSATDVAMTQSAFVYGALSVASSLSQSFSLLNGCRVSGMRYWWSSY